VITLRIARLDDRDAIEAPGYAGPLRIGQIAVPVADLDCGLRGAPRPRRDVPRRAAPDRALPDHELWMAFCRDSEANLLGLMSEVTAP
jgi:hypothetical protein